MANDQSQSDKFKGAARALECNEDDARWDEGLRKIAKRRPQSERAE